jgi:hypothetical protein
MKIIVSVAILLFVIAGSAACSINANNVEKNRIAPVALSTGQEKNEPFILGSRKEELLYEYKISERYNSLEAWVEVYENGVLTKRPVHLLVGENGGKEEMPRTGHLAILIDRGHQYNFDIIVNESNIYSVEHSNDSVDIIGNNEMGHAIAPMLAAEPIESGKEILLYADMYGEGAGLIDSDVMSRLKQCPQGFLVKCKFTSNPSSGRVSGSAMTANDVSGNTAVSSGVASGAATTTKAAPAPQGDNGGIYVLSTAPSEKLKQAVEKNAARDIGSMIKMDKSNFDGVDKDDIQLGTPYHVWINNSEGIDVADETFFYPVISGGKIISSICARPDENGEIVVSAGGGGKMEEVQKLEGQTSVEQPATMLFNNGYTYYKIGDVEKVIAKTPFYKKPTDDMHYPDKNSYQVVNIMEPTMRLDIEQANR